jgi:hypothetical protein
VNVAVLLKSFHCLFATQSLIWLIADASANKQGEGATGEVKMFEMESTYRTPKMNN